MPALTVQVCGPLLEHLAPGTGSGAQVDAAGTKVGQPCDESDVGLGGAGSGRDLSNSGGSRSKLGFIGVAFAALILACCCCQRALVASLLVLWRYRIRRHQEREERAGRDKGQEGAGGANVLYSGPEGPAASPATGNEVSAGWA